MTLRPLVAGLTIAFAVASPWAMGGLGGIRLLAGPGEPFYAEVALDPEQGLENPFVALASRERYSTLAPYSDKASQLQIRTIEVAPQQYLVRLTGPALAPGEAFNFALELSWPSGKVVREYRVSGGSPAPGQPGKKDDSSAALSERHPLIDEPGGLAFGEGRLLSVRGLPMRAEIELLGDWPATISAASFTLSSDDSALAQPKLVLHQRQGRQWLSVSSASPLQQTRVAFNLEARHDGVVIQRGFVLAVPQRGVSLGKSLARPSAQVIDMPGQYRVRPGDTLSGLARRFAQGRTVSQTENALYEANPAAFAHGDRNKLFAGALMKVPAAGDESAAIKPAAAPERLASPATVKPSVAAAPEASAVKAEQPASAPVVPVEEQEKLAQLKAAQQRLDWLESEINRLSVQPAKTAIAHRPEPPVVQDEAFLDENLTQWVLYGAGGLSVASLLAWLLVKRRRAASRPLPQLSRQRSAMGPVTISASLGPDEQPLVQPIADDINLQAIDVLAEADVLMAYGRFDAAEQLLRESLANEPDREDLRMKLLDLIARKGNRREFESVALDLLAVFGPASGLWKRVLQLGGALDPENPLYRSTPDAQEHFVLETPRPPVDLGDFSPEPDEMVPLSRQVDNVEAAQDLARLYREMGDTETADALLREAGIKA